MRQRKDKHQKNRQNKKFWKKKTKNLKSIIYEIRNLLIRENTKTRNTIETWNRETRIRKIKKANERENRKLRNRWNSIFEEKRTKNMKKNDHGNRVESHVCSWTKNDHWNRAFAMKMNPCAWPCHWNHDLAEQLGRAIGIWTTGHWMKLQTKLSDNDLREFPGQHTKAGPGAVRCGRIRYLF